MFRTYLITFLFLLSFSFSFGQIRKNIFQPIIFSSPETGLAVGGILLHRKEKKDALIKGNALLLATYSFNNQINILVKPDAFINEGSYRIKGSIFYKKRENKFWGIGNNSLEEDEENVDSQEFNIHLNFYRRIKKHLYVGLSYKYFSLFDVDLEIGGQLSQSFENLGANGYTISGLGYSLLWDSRQNPINPTSGWYAASYSNSFLDVFGSDFSFNQYAFDVRHYIKISKKKNAIVAMQATSLLSSNNVPWRSTAALGGIQLRGYFKGRFRDENSTTFQAEYRSPIIFWKISTVGFVGGGWVYNELNTLSINEIHPSFGGGLRFLLDKKNRLNLRFDFAVGDGDNRGLYFGLKEAF